MDKSVYGIIGYAGLAKETLFALSKAVFAQSQPPVPKRFDAFLPIFPMELVQNMDYAGVSEARNAKVGPSGFSIDPAEYHRKLHAQIPELYAEDNYQRNFDYEGRFVGRGVFAVDQTWIDHFPQYQPFMGEKLMVYLIGGGAQAVAVPESVYPRGGGVLDMAERSLHIARHTELFTKYARARVGAGDAYDAEAFMTEYLSATGLQPVSFTQQELGQALQDMSIYKSLQHDTDSVGLYTENARRAERVNQYVPMHYACDLFAPEAVDKHTARLAQLHFTDSDYISDFWLPYQELSAYVDRAAMALDMRKLCESYQIAPCYDADTLGGQYPDAVRVVAVRDRELKIMLGEVINNPAYGDGMGPQGTIGKQIYIADSREMIRQRKLTVENVAITTANRSLPPKEYRRCLYLAILQEHKGRLVDAMYRRETALSQMKTDLPVYAKASQLLDEKVNRLSAIVQRESIYGGISRISGYDADIDYLRRKQMDREQLPQEELQPITQVVFAPDALREQSIESGYAMRASLLRMAYADVALPVEPEPEGWDSDAEEDVAELTPAVPESVTADDEAQVAAPDEQSEAEAEPAEQMQDTPQEQPSNEEEEQLGEAAEDTETAPAEGETQPADEHLPEQSEDQADESATAEEYPQPPSDDLQNVVSDVEDDSDAVAEAETQLADEDEPVETEDWESEQPDAPEDEVGESPKKEAEPRRPINLRELTDRVEGVEEPQPEVEPQEEAPKPKLAYILHRGSESTAQHAYRRMSDILGKPKP